MGGERLGRYMVLKHLASGGMADVLLARTEGIEGFERHVVLKRIRAEHAKDQRFIDMFLDEARLAANLHHQNIVQVHDIGESDGEYFFAMEYLHGEDLRTMLSVISKTRTHMPLGIVVSVISSIAAGLNHAHERRGADKKPLNIVHRDVSPSNILVSFDGSVKIVDFGIAKAAMRQVETRSGSLKGKVSYMSPEQCKMGTVDRRSDIYALGVVLYELATTTRLFKSDSDYLVMDAICTGKIPLPRVRRPDLPNELSTIIMKALATDPDRRYQTADEMRVALDGFAVKAQLTSSASTIGAYVTKLCGEKAEPWLDNTSVDKRPVAYAETLAGDDMARKSWTEMQRDDIVATSAGGTLPGTEAKTITDGKGKRRTPPKPMAAVAAPEADPPEGATRTNTKQLAWEKSLPTASSRGMRPAKIAMICVPLLAIAGILGWKLVTTPETKAPVAATAPQPAAAPVQPGSAPAPGAPASGPPTAGPPTAAATVAVAVGPATTGGEKTVDRVTASVVDPKATATKPATKPTKPADPKAVATTAKPADPRPTTVAKPVDPKATITAKLADPKATTTAKPADPKAVTPPTTVKPVDPKAVVTTPTPPVVKPADPKVATPAVVTEAPMATLSAGAVEAVAGRNRKALLACENNETLSGDLTVRFEVDGEGKVVKSQLQSTLGKPKVAGCVLTSVKTWRFPKPPTGSATGVYSISFQ